MSLACSSLSVPPTPLTNESRLNHLRLKTRTLCMCSYVGHPKFSTSIMKKIQYLFMEPYKLPRLAKNHIVASQQSFTENSILPLDWEDEEEVEDTGSPWEGAVVYKRNASATHLEYCTTLERLGLGRLSTEISKSRASAMGIRVTKTVKDYLDGTPVLVSVDVTRKKQKLRLDGIVRTVITLGCNRCFSNILDLFSFFFFFFFHLGKVVVDVYLTVSLINTNA